MLRPRAKLASDLRSGEVSDLCPIMEAFRAVRNALRNRTILGKCSLEGADIGSHETVRARLFNRSEPSL